MVKITVTDNKNYKTDKDGATDRCIDCGKNVNNRPSKYKRSGKTVCRKHAYKSLEKESA